MYFLPSKPLKPLSLSVNRSDKFKLCSKKKPPHLHFSVQEIGSIFFYTFLRNTWRVFMEPQGSAEHTLRNTAIGYNVKYCIRLPGSWHFECFYLQSEKGQVHFVTSRREESMPLTVWHQFRTIKKYCGLLLDHRMLIFTIHERFFVFGDFPKNGFNDIFFKLVYL